MYILYIWLKNNTFLRNFCVLCLKFAVSHYHVSKLAVRVSVFQCFEYTPFELYYKVIYKRIQIIPCAHVRLNKQHSFYTNPSEKP